MKTQYELVIIGGGAAGLAAAQYGARANLSTLVIEEMAPGGQALLIDQLENYPGILEPIAGFDLAEIMKTQAERFGAEFITSSVEKLHKSEGFFHISTSDGEVKAEALILATGAKHRHLGIPGEEAFSGRGVSYCATCDGPFFKGKKILVVGGGDAACDEAMYLAKLSDKIVMIHRRDRFRAQKALAERVLANPNIDVRFNTVALEIKGSKKVESVILKDLESDKSEEEAFDAVFVFVGSDPNVALVPDAAKDESNSVITDDRMATNIPGLFAAGDVRVSPFRQIVTACSDGAVAAHAASQYIDEIRGAAYR
ncbi:MAG: thioredoxin-disulfide reductase [Spirochaetia bacterium]|jgi:thioredoxin reductase (NADPH)|nr:thioredoxin-disulfide reductase [Spirochaetia bacterium]